MTDSSRGRLDEGAVLLVVSRSGSRRCREQFLADRPPWPRWHAAGLVCASIGQSTDEAELFVIRTEWAGVGAYRRALSSYDVKLNAVPLLSTAVDESSAFEIVRHWTPEGRTTAASGLAADAGAVGLGNAASAHVPPVSS